MPIAVHLIELAYVLMAAIFAIIYCRKGFPFWECLFLILIICSPYSISIIPFRQDTYESYGLYSNSGILNFLNFYKILGFSVLDLLALFLVAKNLNAALKIPPFFKKFYLGIVVVSIISYTISSFFMWSPELDSVARALSILKSIVYIVAIYCVIDKACQSIGLNAFLRMLANIIFVYCIVNAVLLNFLPGWYTWVKYSFNYLFLDQTDQFIVFLYCVIALWGPLSHQHRYKIYALILVTMLTLSGGKAGIYSLLVLGIAWIYQKTKTSAANLGVLFLFIMLLSWIISYVIGMYMLDISIYTRYFQVYQLFLNYEDNLLLLFFGIGPSKAYIFYDTPVFFDPGAYISDELKSDYKLAFQMPYLSWIKNFGLLGVCFLFAAINNVVRMSWVFKNNKLFSSAAFYALGLYFVLVGFMDFPSFGLKTIIPISLYMYLVRYGIAYSKRKI